MPGVQGRNQQKEMETMIKRETPSGWIQKLLAAGTAVVSFAFLLGAFFGRYGLQYGHAAILVVFFLALCGGFFLFALLLKKIPPLSRRTARILGWVGMALLLFLQLFYARAIYTSYLADSGYVSAVVHEYVTEGTFSGLNYFYSWPNNRTLLYLEIGLAKLGRLLGTSDTDLVLSCFGALCVYAATLLVFFTARRIFGTRAACFVGLLSLCCFAFSPWLPVPYTNVYSMPVPPLTLFLILRFKDAAIPWRKALWAGLLGVACCFGYFLKPINIIFLLAALLVCMAFYKGFFLHWRQKAIYCGCFVLGAALVLGVHTMLGQAILEPLNDGGPLRDRDGAMASFYLMLGLGEEEVDGEVYYGQWQYDDVMAALSQPTREEKTAYHWKVIRERLTERGFWGTVQFVGKKVMAHSIDGSFGQTGENFYGREPESEGPISSRIQDVVLVYRPYYQQYTAPALQAIWVFLLLLLGIGSLRSFRRAEDWTVSALRLALLGFVLYLAVFEAHPRHWLSELPMMVLLAATALPAALLRPASAHRLPAPNASAPAE